MPRSFGIVEEKMYESDFFLEKIAESEDMSEANYYFSAFISAARSVTFALQASLSGIAGFEEWYLEKQKILRENQLARFFTDARNYSQKQGRRYIHSSSRRILLRMKRYSLGATILILQFQIRITPVYLSE